MAKKLLLISVAIAITSIHLWRWWKSPSNTVLSVITQTFIYLVRPHTIIPSEPLRGPGIWLGQDLIHREEEWRTELSAENIQDMKKMVSYASSLKLETKQLAKEHCLLGSVSSNINSWRNATTPGKGLGFIVVRGFPVDLWNEEEASIAFWCIGKHLGRAGAQNSKGDILGHVKNEFFPPKKDDKLEQAHHGKVRQYRTNEAITFHCDAADVVALFCLGQGISGGSSRVVSSGAVFNALKERNQPELIAPLFETMLFDTRGDGSVDYFAINPSRFYNNVLRTFLHVEYMQTAYQHKSAPDTIPLHHLKMLQAYESIANDIALNMDFKRGDMQLVSNHIVLHSRTAFEDSLEESDDEKQPEEEENNSSMNVNKIKTVDDNDTSKQSVDKPTPHIRHLLRMWLSTGASISSDEGSLDFLAVSLGAGELVRIIGNFVKIKMLKLISEY